METRPVASIATVTQSGSMERYFSGLLFFIIHCLKQPRLSVIGMGRSGVYGKFLSELHCAAGISLSLIEGCEMSFLIIIYIFYNNSILV
jgi:hypothetical protein